MATVKSDQLTRTSDDQLRNYPVDDHGKYRHQYFSYTNNTGAALADGTQIDLCKLPPGRVRIIPNLSRYRMTAQGASRVLDIGMRAYYKDNTGTAVAEDGEAFVANKDVSAAVNDAVFDGGAAKMKIDLYSKAGITLFATIAGGTIPAAAVIEGFIMYVYE